MAKKDKNERNHGGHNAWTERKRGSNSSLPYVVAQTAWRKACLRKREAEGRLTEGNLAEMERVGIKPKA